MQTNELEKISIQTRKNTKSIEEIRKEWIDIDTRMNVIYKFYDELEDKLRRIKEEL